MTNRKSVTKELWRCDTGMNVYLVNLIAEWQEILANVARDQRDMVRVCLDYDSGGGYDDDPSSLDFYIDLTRPETDDELAARLDAEAKASAVSEAKRIGKRDITAVIGEIGRYPRVHIVGSDSVGRTGVVVIRSLNMDPLKPKYGFISLCGLETLPDGIGYMDIVSARVKVAMDAAGVE